MRLRNYTSYRTEDVRRFVVAAHEATGTPLTSHKVVKVVWSKHGRHWGWAYYDNSGMLLSIPKGKLDMRELCRTTEHELAHNRGVKHGEMAEPILRGIGYELPAWVAGIALREKEKAAPVDHVSKRAEKAQRMLDKWERKLAQAKTFRAKWARKVAYYERRAALPKTSHE